MKTEKQLKRYRKRRKSKKVVVKYADGTVEVRKPGSFKKSKQTEGGRTRRAYSRYILSPEWKALRKQVLKRDHHACTACGRREGKLHVHHLTYERFEHEFLEDLTTLCEPCHVEVHRF